MNRAAQRLMGSLLGGVLACQLLGGCTREEGLASELDLQSVCQRSSQLRDVELYDGSLGVPTGFVNRHRLAVGLLRWKSDLDERYLEGAGNVSGQGWCTGTLIADDLFLTAGHCLDSTEAGAWRLPHEKGGVALPPAQLAREFVVQFRYETRALSDAASYGSSAEVLRLEEYRNAGVDYAILRLSGHPGSDNGVARLSARDSIPGMPIAILQHPAGLPMKVGAGPVARVLGAKISYDAIDTLGGSSGAGILDVASGKLVGMHTNGGCTKSGGGENFGVTIGGLTAASPMLRRLVDNSRDFLVGDWDNDGLSDLAVFVDGCLYPDADHDGAFDSRFCPADASAEQYFVGNWQPGGPSQLGWRRGNCVYLDSNPKQPLCFDGAPFELLVADWNGDGTSDLGIRKGRCIDFDTDRDGVLDERGYCYGNGAAEDEYLAGRWDGQTRASIAVRRGNAVLLDVDRDRIPDAVPRMFGEGGNDDQYLVGDWNGDGRSELAVRKNTFCSMDQQSAPGVSDREYRDFWSRP
jgi:hypothetical protein